ncbi:hypothetical protein ACFPZ0_17405 [Streptomonospora nanhaiensis]|uniref:hypothetical protein n=1 Tax=Streptomonospora nanhaiensis TaxID=1323731 RepID=UPI001C390684|nr:hypothetical protein [Streptomonospora nanhaiensis]MBV2367237.1 hypothetical protein [Streptomonospora nanhaiensis]MBX9391826.1 hypothetical protein [Streptomonospora nanhaiensis]
MVVGVILACEVLFWVLVLGGLSARYLLRMKRLSTVLLLLVPVLDVVLLAVIAGHLATGGTADAGHGLGALYLGFTVAYGHSLIAWADARFAHRFAGGPPPVKPPKRGPARIRYEVAAWLRALVAAALGAAALGVLIWSVGDIERTRALLQFFQPLAMFLVIHTVISVWDISSALGRPAADTREDGAAAAAGAEGAARR